MMCLKKNAFFFTLCFFVLCFGAAAQSANAQSSASQDSMDETPQFIERKEKIMYGVDSEIVDLIDTLIKDEDFVYSDDFYALFETTRNAALRDKIIDYFVASKDARLSEYAVTILQDPFEEKRSTVAKVFGYVKELSVTEAADPIRELIKNENEDYLEQSITVLGAVGSAEDGEFLLPLFQKEYPVNVKQAIVRSLGELKAQNALETLLEIAKDSGENSSMRSLAVEALGKLEYAEATATLSKLYEDTDANFRTSVVTALATHTDEEAQKLIIEALKDSYFRVRLVAMECAQEQKLAAAVKPLIYRAKNDSETVVKQRAYEALAAIGGEEAVDFLVSLMQSTKQNDTVRSKVAAALLKHRFNETVVLVSEEAAKTLEDDKQKKLRYAFGKELSKYESAAIQDICAQFLDSTDVSTKGTGLDMFAKNGFAALTPTVKTIAENKKEGANAKKAQYILDKLGL